MHDESISGLYCSAEVKEKLTRYVIGVGEACGDKLVGIYLCGSLARGCFHPATSDVDVVVVTEEPCSEAELQRVLHAHREARIPVDATFVTRSQMEVDETPTPVEFVVKPEGEGKMIRLPAGHGDFLIQREDVYECDVALAGPSARKVVRPVPWTALADCLEYLLPHIVPRFKNPALMLCRIAYAFANRKLCSKKEAGEWALDTFEERWRPMIEGALRDYAEGVPEARGPGDALRAFEECCRRYVANKVQREVRPRRHRSSGQPRQAAEGR